MFDPSPAIDALVTVYREAYIELLKRIVAKQTQNRSTAFDEALARDVRNLLQELDATSERWARHVIPQAYGEAVKEAAAALGSRGGGAGIIAPAMVKVHQHAVQILVESLIDDLHDATQFVGRRVRDHWRRAQLEAVLDKTSTGQTIRQAEKSFSRRLADEGLTAFRDSRGREWTLDSYADMVIRSVTAEAQNTGLLTQLSSMGHDLVRMSEHRAGCPICAPYEGRTYSREGKTPGYPTLASVPGFSKGYMSMHPRCRHRIGVYVLEGDPDPEATRAASNRPFDDRRSEADKAAYERQQEQAALRRQRRKLEQQLAVLPQGEERDAVREKLREVRSQQNTLGREENRWRSVAARENRAYYEAKDRGKKADWPGRVQ